MNIADFKNSLDYLVKAELTPFIWGHAGIGKSTVVKQWAEGKGFKFFPFYLGTQSDIGDILGLQEFVRDENGKAYATAFAIPEWLHNTIQYCNENPDSGAVIFLDEFNRGRRDILNGMFSLALDKTFHTVRLPKNCYVIAAGNPPTDEYFTTDVNETALMARFVHIKLEPSVGEWISYANEAKIDHSIVDFIKNQPDLLENKYSTFDLPVKPDRRAYERLNRLFTLKTPRNLLEQLMHGIIGLERTVAYTQFLKTQDRPLSAAEVFSGEKSELLKKWSNPEDVTASCLNVTCDNVKEEFAKRDAAGTGISDAEGQHFAAFIHTIPMDIAYPLVVSLVKEQNKAFKTWSINPKYNAALADFCMTAKSLQPKEEPPKDAA
jgi:hypothetical protein